MTEIEEFSKPRQTALVTTRNKTEKISGRIETTDNISMITRHTPISSEIYAIAINKKALSYNHIKESKVFAINFMPYSKEEEVRYCKTNSGRFKDKFKESGLQKEECSYIDCPNIKEAIANAECEIINEVDAGNYSLFIAKVVKFKNKGDTKRIFYTKEDNFTTTL